MMKPRKIFYWIFMLGMVFNQTSIAQHQHGEECGTVFSEEQLQYFQRTLAERQDLTLLNNRNNIIYIPVWIHVVRRDNGTGGLSTTRVNELMSDLNDVYLDGGIQFYECRTRNLINSTEYYIIGDGGGAAPGQFKDLDLLNIYFIGDMDKCGFAPPGSGGIPGHVVVKNSCVSTYVSTLAHEIGHFLSLIHTHGPKNNGMTLELVDGSNCTSKGDNVCDTPADPGLGNRANTQCQYTGTVTDANGQAYTPMVSNIMSYAPSVCRTQFTDGQFARMRFSALNDYDFICTTCQDTWVSTDYFDFGEDRTSHDYQVNGGVSYPAAASCGTDEGVAVGGPQGTGWIELKLAVLPGAHDIIVRLKAFFINAHILPDIYIDGELYVDSNPMPPAPNCTDGIAPPCDDSIELHLSDIARYTQDGYVVIRFEDNHPGCGADFVLNQLWVTSFDECDMLRYASLPYATGFENGNDGYWRLTSGNEAGQISITDQCGPFAGNYHLTMESNESGNTGTTGRVVVNKADLYVDLSNCNDVELKFKWKHFGDEYDAANDGVFFSDNGGLDYVKVFDLRSGGQSPTAFNVWRNHTLNVTALAAANGLSLSDEFIIRFRQRDNRLINLTNQGTSDGFAFDQVEVNCLDGIAPREQELTDTEKTGLLIYPNPVENQTRIQWTLEEASEVSITLYDYLGQKKMDVLTLSNQAEGTHHLDLDMRAMTKGIYICVVRIGEKELVEKVVLH